MIDQYLARKEDNLPIIHYQILQEIKENDNLLDNLTADNGLSLVTFCSTL